MLPANPRTRQEGWVEEQRERNQSAALLALLHTAPMATLSCGSCVHFQPPLASHTPEAPLTPRRTRLLSSLFGARAPAYTRPPRSAKLKITGVAYFERLAAQRAPSALPALAQNWGPSPFLNHPFVLTPGLDLCLSMRAHIERPLFATHLLRGLPLNELRAHASSLFRFFFRNLAFYYWHLGSEGRRDLFSSLLLCRYFSLWRWRKNSRTLH